MKKNESPNNNAGGLRKIIAISASDFSGCSFTADGRLKVNPSDLTNAIQIDMLPLFGEYQEAKTESDAGDLYEQEISGKITGNSTINNNITSRLASGTWIVLTEDADGNWKLFGNKRVQLVCEIKNETGKGRAALKNTSFSFSCLNDHAAESIDKPL